jgi:hypothetical protein
VPVRAALAARFVENELDPTSFNFARFSRSPSFFSLARAFSCPPPLGMSRYFSSTSVYLPGRPSAVPATIVVSLSNGLISAVHSPPLARPDGVADEDWVYVGDKWLLPCVRLSPSAVRRD